MKRILYKITSPIRTAYWFIFRPRTTGVKCLVEYDGTFLMIRNTYGHARWTFPGGGVQRGESPEHAARRETHEEVGIMPTAVVPIGSYFSTRQYKRDTVHCFYAKIDTDRFKIDNMEVAEAAWFSQKHIPEIRSLAVDEVLNLYQLKFRS